MDEVKIKSSFSQRMLSIILGRIARKKFGPGVDIFIREFEIKKNDTEETCPKYKITVSGQLVVPQDVVEDLICKKRSGSGTN